MPSERAFSLAEAAKGKLSSRKVRRVSDGRIGATEGRKRLEQVMGTLGIITGSCDSEKVEALSQVEGGTPVERLREYRLAPPEPDIQ